MEFSRNEGDFSVIRFIPIESRIRSYDKRLDDKFTGIQVIRYPHIESFLSNSAKYGIVTSQMHRFARRCSLRSDFVYNVSLVIHRMTLKGYLIRMIWPIT